MGQNTPNVPNQQMNMLNDYYNRSQSAPSPIQTEFGPTRQNLANQFTNAITRQTQDYGNIMGQYQGFKPQTTASTNPQVQQGYDTLNSASGTFGNIASTGGYSQSDIEDMRARAMSPITSQYATAMQNLDRARALGGNAGSPNYMAAVASVNRQLPQQLSDATQNVNATLAQNIISNKLQGAQGQAATGQDIGTLAGQEAGRQDTRTTAAEQEQLGAMAGQGSMYAATPGQVNTFGNQALNAYNLSGSLENQQNSLGLTALGDYVNAYTGAKPQIPAWQTALGITGDVLPFFSGGFNFTNPFGGNNTNTGGV